MTHRLVTSNKKNKYGNKKVYYDGIKFDSKRECTCYQRLKLHKIPFEFQKTIEICKGGKSDRISKLKKKYGDVVFYKPIRVKMKIDFYVEINGHVFFLDTKGFTTPDWNNKSKILMYLYPESIILTPKSDKQIDTAIIS